MSACECASEIDCEEKLNFQFAYKQRWNQAAVDFINILRAHFSDKSLFKAKTYLEKAAEMTFVQKICT